MNTRKNAPMPTHIKVRAGFAATVGLTAVAWLVWQVISGFRTISTINEQVAECRSGVMHCSSGFYSGTQEQIVNIQMFQGMFGLSALLIAAITVMVIVIIMAPEKNGSRQLSTV